MTARAEETVDLSHWSGLADRVRVDIAEGKPSYLLQGPNGGFMRLSANAHRLLKLRQSGISSEEIADVLTRTGKKAISGQEIEEKYQELIQRIESIEKQANDNPAGFWLRIPLIPASVVARIAGFLAPLFRPAVVTVLLATLALAFSVVGPGFLFGRSTPSNFWMGYLLLMVSIVFHEFGHASACAYYGARPSSIGFTLYLIYPALYSDVTSAWQLRRGQRVVVDLGGLYFQWLVGGIYLALYLYTGWDPLAVGMLMIAGSSVFSLNPIFKFDGYWMVADSLGVTNLSRQPSRILMHYGKRLLGRPSEDLPWSSRITATLGLYTVLSIFVWGYFLIRIAPQVLSAALSLPDHLMALFDHSSDVEMSALLMSAAMSLLMAYISWRLLRRLVVQPLVSISRWIHGYWTRRREGTQHEESP